MRRELDGALLELAPFPLAQAAPDPESLIVSQGVFEALAAYVAGQADLLGLPGGPALFGKERLGISLCAQSPLLPAQRSPVVDFHRLVHGGVPPRPRKIAVLAGHVFA